MSEEKQIQEHPRTRLTLENYLRMVFLPTGVRQFMEGVNYELELGPIQSKFGLGVASIVDVIKYLPYAALAYALLK